MRERQKIAVMHRFEAKDHGGANKPAPSLNSFLLAQTNFTPEKVGTSRLNELNSFCELVGGKHP